MGSGLCALQAHHLQFESADGAGEHFVDAHFERRLLGDAR
jgi:hypothetical protein